MPTPNSKKPQLNLTNSEEEVGFAATDNAISLHTSSSSNATSKTGDVNNNGLEKYPSIQERPEDEEDQEYGFVATTDDEETGML